MNLERVLFVAYASIAIAMGGCTRSDPLAAPTVYYGEDVCVACGMIISDARFAAATIVATDRGYGARLFDDIGCLLQEDRERSDATARYVRSLRTDEWLVVDAAWFVHSRELRTPMAFGVAAAPSVEQAETLLAEFPGEVLDFAALRRLYAADALRILPEPNDVAATEE